MGLRLMVAILLATSPVFADRIVLGGSSTAPNEYVVEKGDTLWEICERFFDEPRVWPSIWALNPHVTNPHWIYPGDVLRLRLGSLSAPQAGPIDYTVGSQMAMWVSLNEGFIDENRLKSAGRMTHSPEPRAYLADRDKVYLNLKEMDSARIGQRFSVFQVVNDVLHPSSNKVIGRKIRVHGVVQITAIGKKVATATIVSSFLEMERGMYIVPELGHSHSVAPRQNLIDLKGTVVDALRGISELGQSNLVFVDQGSKDGVQVGNRFFVMRRGDGFLRLTREQDRTLPWEQIGEVLVVETQDRSSTAVITRAALEIRKGDRVVMQRHY